jgi:hypothetical protein
MYRFFSGIAISLSDPIGQSDLIEKLPYARSDVFFFNFITVACRPAAYGVPVKPVSNCVRRSSFYDASPILSWL